MAESSTATSQGPIGAAASSSWVPVKNGTKDVAKTIGLEKMMIEAEGRRPFQQVYLWSGAQDESDDGRKSGKSKSTNEMFRPEHDGPGPLGPYAKLPGQLELAHGKHTKAYLEVGIVIGDNPEQYKATGKSRDKQRDQERKRRGVLPRADGAMRVFVPVTEETAGSAKYYVGVKLTDGRLFPRVIQGDCVFFYPEF